MARNSLCPRGREQPPPRIDMLTGSFKSDRRLAGHTPNAWRTTSFRPGCHTALAELALATGPSSHVASPAVGPPTSRQPTARIAGAFGGQILKTTPQRSRPPFGKQTAPLRAAHLPRNRPASWPSRRAGIHTGTAPRRGCSPIGKQPPRRTHRPQPRNKPASWSSRRAVRDLRQPHLPSQLCGAQWAHFSFARARSDTQLKHAL